MDARAQPATWRQDGQVLHGAKAVRSRLGRVGFSLVEVLAVVAVMAILLAISVPRLSSSAMVTAKGETAAAGVADTLRLARRMAVDHGATNAAGYSVVCAATSYTIRDLSTSADQPATSLPTGWSFEANCTVTFDPYGAAASSSGATSLGLTDGTRHRYVNFVPATGYVSCSGG